MSMTRKDYKMLAEILSSERNIAPTNESQHAIDGISIQLSHQLYADNPRKFDRTRFLKACECAEERINRGY